MPIDPQNESLFAADFIEVIQHSRIFSEIDRAALESLFPHLERIYLKQGEILFEQGAVSDSLYILLDGQLLEALNTPGGKHKIVGMVEKGETVGELGALSNKPRSLTIRAAVDCRILKFPREEFEHFSKDHPVIIAKIIDLIITRSQRTIKLISEKKLYQHIAIVRGDRHVPLDKFTSKLKENFPKNSEFIVIDDHLHDKALSHLINEAEQNNQSVIFTLDQDNFSHLSSKVNHIGGIYIVVDGDVSGHLNDFARKILNRHQTPFTTQYELILLHDDHIEKPIHTIHWLDQAEFTLHHHLKMHDNLGYKRILRFMMNKAVGLVFGGGGGKGWVSVGVLKALIDKGVPIDAVGGTSSGSALAACYANGLSFEQTKQAYRTLVESVSYPFAFKNLTWPLISITSGKFGTETVEKMFEDTQVEDLWIPYYAVSANLSTGKEHLHMTGSVWQTIRASVAVPGLAPPMVMDGELHYDGGLMNNLPIDHMRQLLGNDANVIAVCLTGTGEKHKIAHYNFPPALPFRVGLLKKLHLGYKEYRFPPFLHTFMQALLLGSGAKEKHNKLNADILVSPDLSSFKLFDISTKKSELLMEIGYNATLEQLKENPLFLDRLKDTK